MNYNKKQSFCQKPAREFLLLISLFLFLFTGLTVRAAAANGIAGNGTGGVYIDINAAPYTNYANIPTWGKYAYGPSGCAWFASARVNQLTGANCTIYSGKSWYNSAYKNFGFSRGRSIRAKALACYENHVAVVESVNGSSAVVSEGGYSASNCNASTGYCIIHTLSISKLESSRNGAFIGYVYLGSGTAPAGSLSYSSIHVAWTDTWNALLEGSISNPSRLTVSEVGAQIWDSARNMVVNHKEACGLNTSTVNQALNIVREALPTGLRQGETYTFRLWAAANGVVYQSGEGKFTIQDDQKPAISDVYVTDVSETGYTVHCTATDNFRVARVQFPTWTVQNGQDDIVRDWWENISCRGTANGSKYTFRVNVADHNNELGEYKTHIYAYDPAGNYSLYHVPNVVLQKKQEEPDNPDKPENPDNPDNPDKPENPDNPDKPDNPNNPDKPDNPDNPDNPDDPNNPDNPDDPNNSDKPDNPGSPKPPVTPKYCTVQFQKNGGTKLSRSKVTVQASQKIGTLPKAQRKGYTLKGWYTAKSGGRKISASTRISKSQTLYAQWSKVKKPGRVTSLSAKKVKKGKMKITYRTVSGAAGYEIACSGNSRFSKYTTYKTNVRSASKILSGLWKNQTYYVRVRAYKLDSMGKKIYGSYSAKKKVRV